MRPPHLANLDGPCYLTVQGNFLFGAIRRDTAGRAGTLSLRLHYCQLLTGQPKVDSSLLDTHGDFLVLTCVDL